MIKRSEHDASLLAVMRSELKIMNMLYVHGMIKRSELDKSLLAVMRSELEIMNMFYNNKIIEREVFYAEIYHRPF